MTTFNWCETEYGLVMHAIYRNVEHDDVTAELELVGFSKARGTVKVQVVGTTDRFEMAADELAFGWGEDRMAEGWTR